jgi:ribonuclease inhibitor
MPVSGKRCTLKGKNIRSMDRFYREIARQFSFPAHFGGNLDALWDVLITDIEGPLEVVWEDPEASRASIGRDFERVLDVLRKVERKRDDFRLRLIHPGGCS